MFRPAITTSRNVQAVMTMLIAAVGALAFVALNLPVPFLFGPMTACLVAGIMGAPLHIWSTAGAGARSILGVAIGASITMATLAHLPSIAFSVLLVPFYVAVIALIGVPYFRRICNYDRPTAWYAAMPGGLIDMVQFGKEAGGSARSISLVQATRVIVFVTIAPTVLGWAFGYELDRPVGQPAASIPFLELGLMILAALIGWKGGVRIGLFGATIIGPMIVSTILSITGLINNRPPAEWMIFVQFFIGISIGSGYRSLTLQEFRRDIVFGLGYAAILVVVTGIFFLLALGVSNGGNAEILLAFAPAGQAEMTMLAIVIGADVSFVVTHHVVRVILIIIGAPLAAKLTRFDQS